MPENKFDIVVIGGGPGGYVAAIRASQLGLKTALVERELLGGTCLNWGCIPTKSLLRTSEIYHLLQNLDEFGLHAKGISIDFSKVVKRSRKVANTLEQGVAALLKKNKVKVFLGAGRLGGENSVIVEGQNTHDYTLRSKNIILATGARAQTLPKIKPDGKRIWSYKEAMVPRSLPKSLLVIGSGAIGIEFASFYNDLGTDVTVVEVKDNILPVEDKEISSLAQKSFEARGMKIHTNTSVIKLNGKAKIISATLENQQTKNEIEVEKVILAVGILGNTEGIGIEKTSIIVEDSHILVNEWYETGETGIFAIGDLVGPPWLAHKASHEGVICVEHIAGLDSRPLDLTNIPGCTYCRPQVASVGYSEEVAKKLGYKIKVGRFPLKGSGKAVALGDTEGLIKTIIDEDNGALLGAHMIGPEVTEMIHGYALARNAEMTEAEIIETVFPHPTLSEAMHEAVLDAYGRVIHF
ncbi:MAG: dihydrolipoyl dehydrogenase [Pseudomonadota bacterium]|nr:dihydrolipoyl dehydrogenase [Pseudomonadota bacterium]